MIHVIKHDIDPNNSNINYRRKIPPVSELGSKILYSCRVLVCRTVLKGQIKP